MLNVAMISFWHVHADGYAREFNENENSRISVVWDENPERGKEKAAQLGVDFEADLDTLLKRPDVDAVCITTPTAMHKDVMIACANAKKHIFTEKVLTLTNEDAYAVRDAVINSGIKFLISFPHRTFPENLLAKKIIDEKLIGDVTLLRVRNAHNGSSRGWLPPHFYDEKECGGGAMMDLGAHPMYLTAWLMGKPQSMKSIFTKYTKHEVEDNAVSIMEYENGAIAIAETGFVSDASPFALELYGTKGTYLFTGPNREVQVRLSDEPAPVNGWTSSIDLPKALPQPIQQFVDGVINDKPMLFDINEAVTLTEMMVMAYAGR